MQSNYWVLLVLRLATGSIELADDELLSVIRNAQVANGSRYPSGELRATLIRGQRGPVNFEDLSYAHTIWSGTRSWTEGKIWKRQKAAVDPQRSVAANFEWIVDDAKYIEYHPEGKRANVKSRASYEPHDAAFAQPYESWTAPIGSRGLTWSKMLNPRVNSRIDPARVKFKVAKLSDDLIEVKKTIDGLDLKATLLFSLSSNCNVVSYEIIDDTPGYTSRGTLEWAKNSSGDIYLKSAQSTDEGVRSNGSRITVYHKYEVTEFQALDRVDSKRFDIKSLPLAIGTIVSDDVANRKWKVGDLPAETILDSLPSLIEEMKSRGFASKGSR